MKAMGLLAPQEGYWRLIADIVMESITLIERTAFSRPRNGAILPPNGIPFRVTKNEGVRALHDFAGENEVRFALLNS
jgi:hypothetical protein